VAEKPRMKKDVSQEESDVSKKSAQEPT